MRRRVVWSGDTDRCAACDGEFRLDQHHYYPLSDGDAAAEETGLLCSWSCVESYRTRACE
jgi:hypothetical protein